MFDTWQEHTDHEDNAAYDDTNERYASSALDMAHEAYCDEDDE